MAATLKNAGHRVIGCFPPYPPLELLHSMGCVPVVLWNLRNEIEGTADSDRHLQTFTCSVGRHLTQFLLGSDAPQFDGLLMTNACDTLRNLPEIITGEFQQRGRELPFFKLHIPAIPPAQTHGRDYLEYRIQALIDELETAFGQAFSGEAFRASTALYQRAREELRTLEGAVADGSIPFAAFHRLSCTMFNRPIEVFLQDLKIFRETRIDHADSGKPRTNGLPVVMLSGIIPPPDTLIEAIETAGLRIAGNDLGPLFRSYQHSPSPGEDPVAYYRDFYGNHTPCSTLLYTSDRRIGMLEDLADRRRVQGVIFIGEKYCECETFEFPFLENRLKHRGFQVLQLECAIDDRDHVDAFKTRIEVFAEILTSQGETAWHHTSNQNPGNG